MRHTFLLSSVISAQVLPGQMEMVSRWPVVLLDTQMGLTGAWTTPSTSHPRTARPPPHPPALLKLPAGPLQRAAGWGPARTKHFQFPLQFFPSSLQCFGSCRASFSPLFQLALCFEPQGRPKTLQNIPECKAFAMSHSCRGASEGCSRLSEGTREEG